MRVREINEDGSMSVRAISGSYVVLLGIDMDQERSKGVLGFGIERTDHSDKNKTEWLRGFKFFKGVDNPDRSFPKSNQHPIQDFSWSDFTTRKDHEYTYRVIAMRGEPDNLVEGESVSVRVKMEDEETAAHAVYFNRGIAGSQAYERKFGNLKPQAVPNREAFRWLSRGLFRAMLNFINQAKDESYGLRAAVYEFNQGAVVNEFADAAKRGADVKIIFDARRIEKFNANNQLDKKKSKLNPCEANKNAISKAGIQAFCIERSANPNYISHNKFIVLLKDGKPIEVWTGSTNMTEGGIFGHSNVGHIVRDPDVAAEYLAYWEQLSQNPEITRKKSLDKFRQWNHDNSPIPNNGLPEKPITTVFSPRQTLKVLEWYTELMDNAKSAVFLTAAFGVNELFQEVFAEEKDYIRYLLLERTDEGIERLRGAKFNRIAVGEVQTKNEFERWLKKELLDSKLTGQNRHVKYIHTKYMLIDPLGDDPIVITGSANFSDASTRRNDENMLVIRGNTQVADIYLGEFMRLFKYFYFREVNFGAKVSGKNDPDARFLKSTDEWRIPFYEPDTPKFKERLYFSGS